MIAPADLSIELAYQESIGRMPASERVARSAAMFQWCREQIARKLVAERGPIEDELLKWLVADRLYGREPDLRELIQRKLKHVSS